jgi:hypothetical protein
MKIHTVTYFELKWPTSLVVIAFLLGFGSLQVGLDEMDYLLNLGDKVRTKDCPLTTLDPV